MCLLENDPIAHEWVILQAVRNKRVNLVHADFGNELGLARKNPI